MASPFGEHIAPTAAIKSILDTYPYSIGLFRELLQNSDDAKATKQIFVLDYRDHLITSLHHEKLASTQGPALLAYNNTEFAPSDWEAIQSIYQSSKTVDTSKIGKYGIGFRSCYHITDNPQILSGPSLALLDPHCAFSNGGVKLDVRQCNENYPDQLSGFEWFFPETAQVEPFPGTVIRLPLRTSTAQSAIRNKVVSPTEIHQLLKDFIQEEISIAMLFLSHITSIEIHEVDSEGKRCLAKADITKRSDSQIGLDAKTETYICTVAMKVEGTARAEQTWRVLKSSFSPDEAAFIISQRLGYDATRVLFGDKLLPEIAIAMPLYPPSTRDHNKFSGRLFTYLPLPLPTGFPCHIHSLFALTSSRQNLRNGNESGLVAGSKDSILVQWNHVLFDIFIPRAWASLLPILVEKDHISDVFRAWPHAQPIVAGGDPVYWESLPENLLKFVVDNESSVWPVVPASSASGAEVIFKPLDSVLVTFHENDENEETLAALAAACIAMTRPPTYFAVLFSKAKFEYAFLHPHTARLAILDDPSGLSALRGLPRAQRYLIISYLISHGALRDVADLPLFLTVDNQLIALKKSADTDGTRKTHILMTREDAFIFSCCDAGALALYSLPSAVAQLLVKKGPTTLNVSPLTCERVVIYLGSKFRSGVPSLPDSDDIDWLFKFWAWFAESPLSTELLSLVRSLHILPSTGGTLESLDSGIFAQAGELGPLVVEALGVLGLKFFHSAVSTPSLKIFHKHHLSNDPYLIHEVLDAVALNGAHRLREKMAGALLRHFMDSQAGSCRLKGALTRSQKQKLYALPIFPLLVPPQIRSTNGEAKRQLGLIPPNSTIKCVATRLLPIIPNMVFLDIMGTKSQIDQTLLANLQSISGGEITLLSTSAVLEMAIGHLPDQPACLQRAFVEYFAEHDRDVSPSLLQKLERSPFVPVANGTSSLAPSEVIDPYSDLASLFNGDNSCLPHMSNEEEKIIIAGLHSLQVLRHTLTNEIILNRIDFIARNASNHSRVNCARQLLYLMNTSKYDYSKLVINPDVRWLPTAKGLCTSQECHHRDANDPALFDEVLESLEVKELSSSLRRALSWDSRLPLDIVKQQLGNVLPRLETFQGDSRAYRKIVAIINEFGRREHEMKEDFKRDLRSLVSDSPWIPISSNNFVTTSRAVFQALNPPIPGFFQIPLSYGKEARDFLLAMGCADQPSKQSLIHDLIALKNQEDTRKMVKHSLSLLEGLATSADLDEGDADQILVPTDRNDLHPLSRVYFNDVGEQAFLLRLSDEHFLAHQKIDDDLAQRLKMKRLGLSHTIGLNDDEDMGELLTTRIKNVLRQYTERQLFNEIVANAADAGATQLSLLVDGRTAGQTKLLSSKMAQFQVGPSLIIYNNATFSDEDFKGICRVGTGGKEDRPDTIGQFGLGALSMFHFTEMVMIISGAYVLFLDPSKAYLPYSHRASVKIPLTYMRSFYSDHIDSLNGLFGFSCTADHYNGTLFRLPLRSASQAIASTLVNMPFTLKSLTNLISDDFRNLAPQTLFFTGMELVTAEEIYTIDGTRSIWWRFSAERHHLQRSGDFASHIVDINIDALPQVREQWQIVSTEFPRDRIPDHLLPLVGKHRIRSPITLALAANLNLNAKTQSHKLFTRLPLQTITLLPVHLHGDFIPAEDRRSIRCDGGGHSNAESEYNHWLLSERAPSLYIFLLELLLHNLGDNTRWWPRILDSSEFISDILIDSFWKQHLGSTDRSVCRGLSGSLMQPRQAVLLGHEPSSVSRVLRHLQPPEVIELPQPLHRNAFDAIQPASPDYVAQVFLRDPAKVVEAFNTSPPASLHKIATSLRSIEIVIHFLLGETRDEYERLFDLPLLPLFGPDIALGTFRPSGTDMVTYYRWSSPLQCPIDLPQSRLVHPDFSVDIPWDRAGLNVSMLDGPAVRELVQQHLKEEPRRDGMSPNERTWINSFWSGFRILEMNSNLTVEDISSFPLVPTITDGQYVSLEYCHTENVIFAGRTSATACLGMKKLGATVVLKEACPPSLLSILESPAFQDLPPTFKAVLRCLRTRRPLALSQLRSQFGSTDYDHFSTWAQSQFPLVSKTNLEQEELYAVARELPIWPAFRRGAVNRDLFPACEVIMLPHGISHSVVNNFIAHGIIYIENTTLGISFLDVKPSPLQDFSRLLELPRRLDPGTQIQNYKDLLRVIISPGHLPDNSHAAIRIPNRNGVLSSPGNFYAYSCPLFRSTFELRPTYFVHELFEDLEADLVRYGLHDRLSFETFTKCARVIDEDVSGDIQARVTRAHPVYEYYSEELPILIGSHQERWRQLDLFSFIPRDDVQNRFMDFDAREFTLVFPEVVSPGQVLRPELEPIAWTQRPLFMVSPHERLLLANSALGIPTAEEVVNHLRVLTKKVAQKYRSHPRVLSDLTATYKWLNEHQDKVAPYITKYCREPLWLNVDDPSTDPWTFHSSGQIFIGIMDSGTGHYGVKDFLMTFESLLLAADIQKIQNPSVPERPISTAEAQLWSLRAKLQKMRSDKQLTDVVFVSDDGTEVWAHKFLLVALAAQHFGPQFCGNFNEAIVCPTRIPMSDYSTSCLEFALDYIYKGPNTLSDVQDQEQLLNILLNTLRLSNYWGLEDLHYFVQHELIPFISLDLCAELYKEAGVLNAKILMEKCEWFEEENAEALRKIRSR